jgi:hypothetical protein
MEMTDQDLIRKFVHAGHATFTLVGTSTRYTFKVDVVTVSPFGTVQDNTRFFVSLLTEPGHYTYIGMIRHGQFQLTRASKYDQHTKPVMAFMWFYKRLLAKHPFHPMQFWHEGKCGRCGQQLTVPESIERGLGPVCAGMS